MTDIHTVHLGMVLSRNQALAHNYHKCMVQASRKQELVTKGHKVVQLVERSFSILGEISKRNFMMYNSVGRATGQAHLVSCSVTRQLHGWTGHVMKKVSRKTTTTSFTIYNFLVARALP